MNDKNVKVELPINEFRLLVEIVMTGHSANRLAPMVSSILSKLAAAQLEAEKDGK